jgi:hypothetical protein
VELAGDVPQHVAANGILRPVKIEEADDSFRLLKRLDQPVQQNPIETPIAEADAILVVLEKGVHENLQWGERPGRLHP